MNEKFIKNKINKMYANRKWDLRVTNIIIEFVIQINKTYGDKYINRILNRLQELEEIKKEYNNTRYKASSKKNYIVFFKEIKDDIEFKYILEHELFHFIQKENSEFEKIPRKYAKIIDSNVHIELLEEAFVQYFTARINNKKPEYIEQDKNGKTYKYWLNEAYKEIVGKVEKIEEKVGIQELLDMYMDDKCYEEKIIEFDKKYGENEFAKYISDICFIKS